MSEIHVVLEFDRGTKRTRRYVEDAADPAEALIGTLYVPKSTLRRLGEPEPQRLSVTVALA